MMMKKLLWITVATALLVGCNSNGKKSNTEEVKATNKVVRMVKVAPSCTELEVSGDWCVEMSDSVDQPTIEVDEELMSYLKIEEGDWKLKLDNKPRMMVRMKNHPKPCLQLPSKSIFKEIDMKGATELIGVGTMSGEDLKLKLNGKAIAKVDSMNFVGEVDIEMSGATTYRCQSLKMEQLDVEMSGSSDAKLAVLGLEKNIDVEMSGASNMTLNCSVMLLDLKLSGSSELYLIGHAGKLNASLSGSSVMENIEKSEGGADNKLFIVDNAKININGKATAKLQCNDKLKVNASGDSYVRYKGKPKTAVKSSGASRVEAM